MSEVKPFLPLSNPQKKIWHLEKFYPNTSMLNISATMKLKAPVDFACLERAINLFIQKNDSMRLHITEADGKPGQYVREYYYQNFELKDFSHSDIGELYKWDAEINQIPLFATDSDLFRFVLLKIDENTCGYYVMMHHIIADAWTFILLGNAVARFYRAFAEGLTWDDDASPTPSYVDYIEDELAYLKSARFEKDKAFWSEQFGTLPEPTMLKHRKTQNISTSAARKTYVLPQKLYNKLHEHIKATGSSVFAVFLSTFVMYLNRITGKDDIVIGVPVLNRINAKARKTTGMFISTVPVRLQIDEKLTYADFSQELTEKWTSILRHQRYPIDQLLSDIRKKFPGVDRLYDIMCSYQNARFSIEDMPDEYDSRWHFSGHQNESLCIHFNDRESEGKIIVNYDYLTDLFNAKDIDALHDHFIRILWHSLDAPGKSVAAIDMVSEKEKSVILEKFNDTGRSFPSDRMIHSFFEERAESSPDAVAVVFGDSQLSYRELDEKSNELAHSLRAKGVEPDVIVALMMYRSLEMMIAILAVWKAGGAYMPIDPAYPAERILYMLEDSGAPLILSISSVPENEEYTTERINIDHRLPTAGEKTGPEPMGSPSNLAYVIYTSGSTGNPKGVMVEHRAIVNRIDWMNRKYPLQQDDVILQKTTYTFDVSLWELTWWFYAGIKLVFLGPGDEKRPSRLIDAIEKHRVTVLHFVPSMLNAFLDYINAFGGTERLSSLRVVFASGEALTPRQVNEFHSLLYNTNRTLIVNLYGPTEAAVDVSYFNCVPRFQYDVVPIGRPISNIKLYIVDDHMNLQPIGVSGELCIGGVGLARGYLNRPELTAEKFVDNPFVPGEKLYKTGDLARWFPRGDIEYLGRKDSQVKIRGYRIELGDIRHHLEKHECVREAVVTCGEGKRGDKVILAYYVPAADVEPEVLRTYLTGHLPEYMVPSHFIRMESIPLSHSGKVNCSMLPAWTAPEAEEERVVVRPRNSAEEAVYEAWKHVLETDNISVTDDFFRLGGDSISAIEMICRLPVSVDLGTLYDHPRLEDFARHIHAGHDSRLLVKLSGEPSENGVSIICCPYGGGGAYTYRQLAAELSRLNANYAVYALNLPGHDMGGDPQGLLPVRDVAALVLGEVLALKGKLAIYTHCVGGAIGMELARLLELSGRHVEKLFAGGIIPPLQVGIYGAFFDPWRFVGNGSLSVFLTSLGLPEIDIDDSDMGILFRAFRHDVREYYRYMCRFIRDKKKLDVPVCPIVGQNDGMTRGYARKKRNWENFSAKVCGIEELSGGGHYFLKTHSEGLAAVLHGHLSGNAETLGTDKIV